MRNGLKAVLMEGLVMRYKKAFAQVEFILEVERRGKLSTLNRHFTENLEPWYNIPFFCGATCYYNIQSPATSPSVFDQVVFFNQSCKLVVPLDSIVTGDPLSNVEHTVQDLHDILKSYYEVARKRFVDVVPMQAAGHYLISGPETPLKLSSPVVVGARTPEQLEDVAGKDPCQRRRRKQLQKEIEDLEIGKKILM